MPGPPPKPTALKIAEGNPGKRPLNRREPKPPAQGLPPCPRHLKGAIARAAWKRIGSEVAAMKVMTAADAAALETLCSAYQEYRKAWEVVNRKGLTVERKAVVGGQVIVLDVRPRPEVRIGSDAWKRVAAMLQQFGLTPASRTRIQVEGKDDQKQGFAGFVAGRGA